MTFFVRYLKDSSGNNFLGIDIPESLIKLQLQQLKEYIGDLDFELYTQNHLKSHASKYYLSVITHTEYMQLLEELEMDEFINSLDENVLKFEIEDLKMLGLGTAASGQNRCFFIVCKSDSLQAVRERYNLEKKDLHITLGFDKHNVQGVRKNEIIKKGNKFLKLLALEFYKTETWDFIKSIGNYDLDRNSEIIPISLDDSKLKVKIDGYYLQIIYLEDGEKFWIGSKATVDERLPRLAQTEIYKIFNKNTTYGTL
jgi:hypothetical protein